MYSANASGCLIDAIVQEQTTVLVVEDDKLVNWSLVRSLTTWGFAVCPVFTGRDAVKELDNRGFDIVLLDYQLPDMDGLSVAHQVRHLRPAAVIVLLTSFQLSELPKHQDLINYHFTKPLDLGRLRRELARISNKQEPGT